MSRGRSPRIEDDLHGRFSAWLQDEAPGDPPRDAAVHAAHCVRCRSAMLAFDHLLAIDPGRALLPASRGVAPRGVSVLARPRLLAATAASLVVVASAAWIGAGVLAPGLLGDGTEVPPADQGVLGGLGAGGSATPSPAPSFGGVTSESGSAAPTTTPAASEGDVDDPATAAPGTAQPVPATPPPSIARSTTPSVGQSRTPAPTATPPVTATPSPSVEPTPFGACDDGIDNDGDLLIDIADPGCALDGNEFAA